jgi:hypothetical protein
MILLGRRIAIYHLIISYCGKKDNEKAGIFRKIEVYLTYPNFPQLERQDIKFHTDRSTSMN